MMIFIVLPVSDGQVGPYVDEVMKPSLDIH
jgi:hypothetical protein